MPERFEGKCGRNSVLLDDLTVEAIMCSLNEVKLIEESLKSATHQCLIDDNPGRVRVTLADSGSTDGTLELVKGKFPSVHILTVPMGKVTARDIAIRASSADVILSIDADTVYPYGFFARLVRHFADPNVVAVTGMVDVDAWQGQVVDGLFDITNSLGLTRKMYGSGSAFRREAYLAIGGFNTEINQKNFWSMWMEEEFGFGDRLSRLGMVVYDRTARAKTSDRRFTRDPDLVRRGAWGRDTF